MKKLGRTGQRVLKIIHIFFASLWVGGAVTLNAALLLLGPAETMGELLGYNYAAKLIDDAIIVPGAMGCLITGVLISGLTPWGFFRHRWVTVKYVMTVVCIVVGIVVLGPTVNDQPAITMELGVAAYADPIYHSNYVHCLLGGAFQLTSILFMLSISSLKPWQRAKLPAAPAAA
ncbi:MAG: hypothetical protein LBR80_18575 [Deltaproteobacteria bacterium]|jgi:hypothetical protein|nr:hypothetical protein [Deltaproteobacteria bacterium]